MSWNLDSPVASHRFHCILLVKASLKAPGQGEGEIDSSSYGEEQQTLIGVRKQGREKWWPLQTIYLLLKLGDTCRLNCVLPKKEMLKSYP